MTTDQFVDITAAVAVGTALGPLVRDTFLGGLFLAAAIPIFVIALPFLMLAQSSENRRRRREEDKTLAGLGLTERELWRLTHLPISKLTADERNTLWHSGNSMRLVHAMRLRNLV